MRRYLLMEVKPATHARPDMRRRRYPLAEPVDEEVVDELSPAANPYTAVWTPPQDFGTMTTASWLALRQPVSGPVSGPVSEQDS
jgi:hypothetical protein